MLAGTFHTRRRIDSQFEACWPIFWLSPSERLSHCFDTSGFDTSGLKVPDASTSVGSFCFGSFIIISVYGNPKPCSGPFERGIS